MYIIFWLQLLVPSTHAQGPLDCRGRCGEDSPLECQSPSPGRTHTFRSPQLRQRICSTNQWTPPPEWVEKEKQFQKQNLPSKVLLDEHQARLMGWPGPQISPAGWVQRSRELEFPASLGADCTVRKKVFTPAWCWVAEALALALPHLHHVLLLSSWGLPFPFCEVG